MANDRFLIVNADDLGLSRGVNRGIVRAHTGGILTSASLMVRQPAAAEAADLARAHPRLGIGLHVDLAEWAFREGEWRVRYQVVPVDDRDAVAEEVTRQLAAFRRLLGRDPTHLDSHQHVHRHEPARTVLLELARQLGVPLRDAGGAVRFCGDFYGQTGEGEPWHEGITVENLLQILGALAPGWTEVSCHPADDDQPDSVYRAERKLELRALCDPRVRAGVKEFNLQLRSFAEAPRQA
jgi:predicted glycoside hydrolase/deacetylase ChbG (UPF0249 family)